MNDHLKKEYDKNGFVIIRNIIDSDLVLELENHVYWMCKKYPNIHPEAFHHDLLVNDPFIHKVLNDKKILVTPSGWEAVIEEKNQKVYIRKDGKTWAEDL